MINPLYDIKTDNQNISSEQQAIVNKPMQGGQLPEADQSFLTHVMTLVDDGTIKLYEPSTLINQAVYTQLSPAEQGKVDLNAVNMLNKIRTIVEWEKSSYDTNVQVQSMIQAVRLDKERLEANQDLFLI